MDETRREEIALFRYGVISELVTRTLAPGEKARLLAAIAEKTWTIPGTSRRQIAATTARDWVALYEAMGFEGLKPVARSDAGRSRAIPEAVQDLLLALRRERPQASVHSLIRAARLSGRVAAEVRLAPSTVHRFFAAQGVVSEPPGRREPDARAFTHPHAGDLWMVDVMHGPRLWGKGRQKGAKSYLIAFLDDATRLVPYAAFYPAENSTCFHDAFKQALLRRGVPRKLYCDNGSVFRSQHLQVVCATLNVALIHSRPHHPRGRGKCERFFRHVRTAFLPHLSDTLLGELETLNRVFWAWLESEYHNTAHSGLDGGKTPLERLEEDFEWIREAPGDLERLMRMKVLRRVARDRTVRLDGRCYEAPEGFAGERVEVLYDPYDPHQDVYLRRPGELEEHRLRYLDRHLNATLRRLPRESSSPPPVPPPEATGISYLDLVAQQYYQGEDS